MPDRQSASDARAADAMLMRRVVDGDESALGQLYDRYAGLVYSVASRVLGEVGAAEEILQDVFYQLWRTAARFDPARGSLPGWLVVTARNRAISRLRGRSPLDFPSEDSSKDYALLLPFDAESAAEQQELLERVRAVMAQLPDAQRQALEMAYFEGMTHSEIAMRTQEPLGTIKSRLRAGLESLKQSVGIWKVK